MTHSVLVPMDGGDSSVDALEYALRRHPESEITVLHVIGLVDTASQLEQPPDGLETEYRRAKAAAERLFDEARDRAAEAGVELTTALEYGPPSEVIPEYAESTRVDHIIMGEHGQSGSPAILLGSVAETVARRATAPVTVVRNPNLSDDERVLVPVDGSDPSNAALSFALDSLPNASVTVMCVAEPVEPEYDPADEHTPDPTDTDALFERAEREAEGILTQATELADSHGVDVETVLQTGEPHRCIVSYADEHGVDHVVLGSHGRAGLRRLLLGSVAEQVLRRSNATVTVVRD